MAAVLDARKAARDAVKAAVPLLTVLYPHDDAPTSGEYVVVTDISAPDIQEYAGRAFQRVRVQVDVWTLSPNDTRAGLLGAQLVDALDSAGWTVGHPAKPLSFEGQKNAAGARWFRYSFDARNDFK